MPAGGEPRRVALCWWSILGCHVAGGGKGPPSGSLPFAVAATAVAAAGPTSSGARMGEEEGAARRCCHDRLRKRLCNSCYIIAYMREGGTRGGQEWQESRAWLVLASQLTCAPLEEEALVLVAFVVILDDGDGQDGEVGT